MDQTPKPKTKPTGSRAEARVYGYHSCLALAACRFPDILRIYLVEERVRDVALLLKSCAAERKPYRVVTAEELEKITESRHHEGICIAAKPRTLETIDALAVWAEQQKGSLCLVALEEIGNPHNVGAILRVAAHFGVDGVLIRQPAGADRVLSSAVYRTSEGGAERCRIVACADLEADLGRLRDTGFRLVSTSSHAEKSIYETRLPERSVILLGAEATGLPWDLRKRSDFDVAIPGSGTIESLNVSCAAAVCLGEFWHQHRGKAKPEGRPRSAKPRSDVRQPNTRPKVAGTGKRPR